MTPIGVASARRLVAPLGVAGCAAAVAVALGSLKSTTLVPFRCPFLALTSLDCPFCGGTRGAAALIRGDLPAALDLNAYSTIGLLGGTVVWALWLLSRWRGRPLTWTPSNRLWLAFAVTGVVFAVLRNLPGGPTAGLAA